MCNMEYTIKLYADIFFNNFDEHQTELFATHYAKELSETFNPVTSIYHKHTTRTSKLIITIQPCKILS